MKIDKDKSFQQKIALIKNGRIRFVGRILQMKAHNF